MQQSQQRRTLTRREALQCGVAGMLGLSLPELLRRRAESATTESKERTAIIVVWLHGGASHLETYDPKPYAGDEYSGPFSPISTATPGLEFSELLPRQAAISDKFTILRSVVHTGFCHQQGQQQLFTGHPVRQLKQSPDNPGIFEIVNRLTQDPSRLLPNYVGVPGLPYMGAAYLGPQYEAFNVNADPNQANFSVPNLGLSDVKKIGRIGDRVKLRVQFDKLRRDIDERGSMQALDAFEQQAINMLTSTATRDAFDLSREPDALRDRYGRTRWGQQCLMARRLVEAGVDLVTTTFYGIEGGRASNWDDHAVNWDTFKASEERSPVFDRAVASLIEDLYERGLDRRVLVLVTGEFGRTPKISVQKNRPGRDHWPSATSMLFAGGGIETGQVIGRTDSRGEFVTERRVGVQDFLRTLYKHLNIDPVGLEFTNFAGRPVPIVSGGKPIPELVAAG